MVSTEHSGQFGNSFQTPHANSSHTSNTQDTDSHMQPNDNRIAVVDFAPFLDGSNKLAVADKILSSFKDIGFVYLLNHGIPQAQVDQMFALVRHFSSYIHAGVDGNKSTAFFKQPMDVKMLAPHPASGTHHRGIYQLYLDIIQPNTVVPRIFTPGQGKSQPACIRSGLDRPPSRACPRRKGELRVRTGGRRSYA
jgi:hypothetical protein